ncbi:MAG TPA: Rieske 2Fe-2S domain-containing protein [Polyangia bacterium]
MTWLSACPLSDLRGGEMRGVVVAGHRVLLVNVKGSLHAFPDRCAHKGVPLSLGRLQDGVITCWAHEWQYDACTGAGINPDDVALLRIPLKVEQGRILIDVSADPAGAEDGTDDER